MSWKNNTDDDFVLSYAQAAIAKIVERMQPRDDFWYILTSKELGVTETVLRDYATHGDSLSLAILIHIVRQYFLHFEKKGRWPLDISRVLEEASKLNVQDTSPELQHNFCALWNQIVLQVQNNINNWSESSMASCVLGPLRHAYITLHQDTDCSPTHFSTSTGDRDRILSVPSAYPLCSIPGHRPDSATHIHDVPTSATFTRCAVQYESNNAALVLGPRSSDSDASAPCIFIPFCFDESLTDAPPLDSDIPVSVQTTTELPHIHSTLPSPVTNRAVHGSLDTSITAEHTAVSITSSGGLDAPLSHSPCPSSAIYEDVMATPDIPSQVLSPHTVVDAPITGLSRSSLDAENAGEHPLQG